MISSWVQFQKPYHTATPHPPVFSVWNRVYRSVRTGTFFLPRIISLHDISLCSQKIRKKKKREKGWGASEMEGGGFLGLEIEREAKGTKCNLDKAVSLLTSSSRPLNRNVSLYILYILCILYILYILYIIWALYIIGSIWYAVYIIYRYI